MDLTLTTQQFVSNFIVQWWTPAFFVIFVGIIAYAVWPRNCSKFDEAARLPLRED